MRSYKFELIRIDKDGRFDLMLDNDPFTGKPIFKRFYIDLNALKKGFMVGCRAILGFEGTFFKDNMIWSD